MRKIISLSITLAIIATLSASAAVRSSTVNYVQDELIVKFRPGIADRLQKQLELDASANQMKLSQNLDEIKAEYRVKEIKPLFRSFRKNQKRLENIQTKEKTLLSKKEKHILWRLNRAAKTTAFPELDRIYKLKVDLESGQTINNILKAYKSDPDVEYAELNYIVSVHNTPNDPLYPLQWPLNNTGQDYPDSGKYNSPPGTPDSDIDAPQAWDHSTGDSTIVVAVVDTGVDYSHRDLKDNMWLNQAELNGTEGIDDDENGYVDDIYGYDFINNDSDPDDDSGHGTHCSGIIAAKGDNAADITGVCWNASIMALKFLGASGSGTNADALEAFYYAVENGADVVSNSWGGGSYSQTMEEVIEYAHSQGVIMVASAGNEGDTGYQYPAYYNHVLSVAATDSDDQKASFSTYGDWVDIAAPGVDILSLRATGTSLGKTYDGYTTIASGTSMSCPHVAGACAFMFSVYPEINLDELETYLKNSADPIDPNICVSGRLNLYEAMLQIIGSEGRIRFESVAYSCSDTAEIRLFDLDLAGNSTQQVVVSANGGDWEIVSLAELAPYIGIFGGIVPIDSDVLAVADGILQVSHGQIITVTYDDADNGMGTPVTATDDAVIDCQPPNVFDVQIGFPGRQPKITFKTDEPTTARVLCSLKCSEPYVLEKADTTLATSHTIELIGVAPQTRYFFVIEASDPAGNKTIGKNRGRCYKFTTTAVGEIHVPAQCQTIQQAVDNSWDGGTVVVEDGIYTGQGNRDIDFKARPIMVRSENGPEFCIIDCNGSETEPHRGFYFHSGEKNNSVLNGFTITNGYIPGSWYVGIGGAILCVNNSNPTITGCIITENTAGWDGGGICNLASSPNIVNCTFSANAALGNDGGAINNEVSSPVVTNCTFTANSAYDWGGAIRNIYYSSPVVTNCVFAGNLADDGGAMFYYFYNEPVVINCTFNGNSATNGNSIASETLNSIQIKNSIISDSHDEIWNGYSMPIIITYSNVSGGWPGIGNIDLDPCFVDLGYYDANGYFVDGDYRLLSGSPCIDRADNASLPKDITDLDGDSDTNEPIPWDLDGNERIYDGDEDGSAVVDMGAFEAQPRDPLQLLLNLTQAVISLDLPGGIENSLRAKLDASVKILMDDKQNNDIAAVKILKAFINSVQALNEKKISEPDADDLIEQTEKIIGILSDE